jgi:hypothetical protein
MRVKPHDVSGKEEAMVVARSITLAIASSVLLGLGGCVTTRGSLTTSADRLEHSAQVLAQSARDEPPGRDYPAASYSRSARELADRAYEFRRTAEDRSARDAEVKQSFERLSRSYHALRDEVERSDSREARIDLKPVTESYLDVERAMGGYPERQARADDRRERY